MKSLENDPKFSCFCGLIHVVNGTKIVCVLFLLRIALFIYSNFPRNIPSAAIIALITIASLIGTFLKQPILILPLYLILTLAIGGSIVDILVTVTQYFLYNKEIVIIDAVIQILTFCLLLWQICVVKSCYNYFKWIKYHKNFMPLRNFVHYFNNVLPPKVLLEKQQIVIENELDDSNESKNSVTTKSHSAAGSSEISINDIDDET